MKLIICISIHLQLILLTVKLVKKLELPYYSPSYGEVIKLSNGNYLVQRGNSIDLGVPDGFDEIDGETGEVLFSMDFPKGSTYWVDYIPKEQNKFI